MAMMDGNHIMPISGQGGTWALGAVQWCRWQVRPRWALVFSSLQATPKFSCAGVASGGVSGGLKQGHIF